jgi:hypothetical protein
MNRWRVGEDRGSKEKDRCPLTLAPTTSIKYVLLHISQNLLEVVENLHTAVSADTDNTDDDEAVIQALQHALDQKMKKWVQFDGVEMLIRKGKALESILKHQDQVGAAKENQSSAAGPSAPVSCITVSAPIITTSANTNITATTVKNTGTSDTSGPQYHYSTPVEDPAIVLNVVNLSLNVVNPALNVVNLALNVPISITQRELLSISPEAQKQYKELTTTWQVSTGTTEVGKLEKVPNDSPAVYSRCTVHNLNGSDDLQVGCESIPLCLIFPLVKGKLMVECILDSGCQIVAINNVIWEQLSNNLQVEQALKIEAASFTITKTHGCLHNVHFTSNDIDIYLQVQVMPNTPYDILLGCPFYALTECITKDFANGDQHLTITDPNTWQCITIPTREQKRHQHPDPDFQWLSGQTPSRIIPSIHTVSLVLCSPLNPYHPAPAPRHKVCLSLSYHLKK